MKLNNDYSGEFDPGFNQEKLSREMLLKVAKRGRIICAGWTAAGTLP